MKAIDHMKYMSYLKTQLNQFNRFPLIEKYLSSLQKVSLLEIILSNVSAT